MKCKFCGGTGYVKTISVGGVPCSACNGTGEYEPFDLDVELDKLYPPEQTNEEWFCGLPTEEKAKFFAKQCADSVADFKVVDMSKWKTENWIKWLKEKYREE